MRSFAVAVAFLLGCHAPAGGAGGDDDGVGVDGGDEVDSGATATAPVRFVMLGDQGTGTARQYAVGAAIAQLCATEGCDFVVLLGDNLYPDGADSTSDPVWQHEFEKPYDSVAAPFYAILGNHDFGPSGTDWQREDVQVDYSAVSTRWRMPHEYYTLRRGPVGFVMLDTNRIMWNKIDDGDQRAWWPSAYAAIADAPWRIAVGHHPYRSNGHHGNAGSYGNDAAAPAQNPGTDLKVFFDEYVCGRFDLYAAGHDHDMEWLNAPAACGGTELVVSGAGGTSAPFARDETPYFWHDDTQAGFLYIVADGSTLHGRFVSQDGVTLFERTLTKP